MTRCLEFRAERGSAGLLTFRAHTDPVELLAILAGRFVDEDGKSTALHLLCQALCVVTTAEDAELDGPVFGTGFWFVSLGRRLRLRTVGLGGGEARSLLRAFC